MTEETENWEDLLNVDKIELKKKDEIRFEDEDQELNRKSAEKPKENESKKDKEKKNNQTNEKNPTVIDPFGVPDRKAKINFDEKKKGEQISKENDERNIEELFGDLKFDNKKKDKKIDSLVLTDENTHIQFGRMIGKILNRSGVKSHVVEFAKELLNTLSLNLTSKEYQEINTKVTVLLNQKQKEEKPVTTKKKVVKPSLKATKADQKQIADYDFEPEDEDENNMGVFSNSKYENDDDFI